MPSHLAIDLLWRIWSVVILEHPLNSDAMIGQEKSILNLVLGNWIVLQIELDREALLQVKFLRKLLGALTMAYFPKYRLLPDLREWIRIVVEKPSGKDVDSTEQMSSCIGELFDESQTYRKDGKGTCAKHVATLFCNRLFLPLMNRVNIDDVQSVWGRILEPKIVGDIWWLWNDSWHHSEPFVASLSGCYGNIVLAWRLWLFNFLP